MEVRILDKSEMTIYPRPGETTLVVAVTYQANMGPPRTLWIDKDKLTEANLKAAIRADIEQQRAKKPETLEI